MVGTRLLRRVRFPQARMHTRVMVGFGLVSLVLAATLAATSYSLVRASLLNDRTESVLRQTYTNARIARSRLTAGEGDVATLLAGLQVGAEGGVLMRLRGRWYASSVGTDRSLVPASLRRGVDEGRAGTQITSSPTSSVLAAGVPITDLEAVYFELNSLEDIEQTLRVLASSLALAALVAAAVGASMGAVLANQVVRPLRSVSRVAGEIAEGRLDTRIDHREDRDLELLASSFNRMVDELNERARREARFVSDVSHDLRGPLMALSGAVSIVNRRRDDLPAEAVDAIDALDQQVAAFSALVVDLLEISRFEAGTASLVTREVDALEFVRAVLAERGEETPTVTENRGDDLRVILDPRRMHQVLANLLDNAQLYAGGASRITVQAVPGDGDRCDGVSHGPAVRMVVDDCGPGVPADERASIFDRYVRGRSGTARGAARGTGLGLELARRHVELHGGRIWVEDAPERGARFIVELPRGTP